MTIQKNAQLGCAFFASGRCGVGTKSQLLGSKVGLQAALFCSPYAVVPAREGDGWFDKLTNLVICVGLAKLKSGGGFPLYITYS